MSIDKLNLEQLELNRVIPPEIQNDAFYELIHALSATEPLRYVLEIGSSSGGGSTKAFVAGLSENPNAPKLFCIEVSKPRFELLRETYKDKPFVLTYNCSTVGVDEFPSRDTVVDFYNSVDCGLHKFPLDQVLGWREQDIQYVAEAGVESGAIEKIKSEHGIDAFDMVLIDGSEFTGEVEYEKIKGAKLILLDDTNTFKCYNVRQNLISDPMYDMFADDQVLRNGFSAFRRRKVPKKPTKGQPIHFFTIVLNGEPFIRYHESVFERLSMPWHWHIMEGVADLKHDTAWSVSGGGRVSDEIHDRGRSNDGTSAYLDSLARRYPHNVTIYRKPLDEFWDGKREMVNAPLPSIKEECLLWQIDNDELWTVDQIEKVHGLFESHPDRTAAYYWCWYYVGPSKIISTRYNYAQNPQQEWLRTWRFNPGATWAAHEPPVLVSDPVSKIDIAKINPFMHGEMEREGVVFHHLAYATEAQLQFKEIYYGYADARSQWRKLQAQSSSGMLKDYFGWVSDNTMFDDVSNSLVDPVVTCDASTGQWTFAADSRMSAEAKRNAVRRPRIVVDGVFWQHLSSGIGRVWENMLREWVVSGFAENVVVLDRAGTAPRIPGVHYFSIAAHDYGNTGADSLLLEETCQRLDADLFASTYYSTPTTTPSFFVGYDMIPEKLGFSLEDEAWQEKRRAIIHAAGHSMLSNNSADDLVRFYPQINRQLTHLTRPGVDPAFKRPSEDAVARFRAAHGLANRPYVLLVGERYGHGGYKNGKLAFMALRDMPADRKLSLICVGGRPEIEQELREIAPKLEVKRVAAGDSDLAAAYAGAHCLIYPSLYEGFGIPPLEAMACGTPAVVCRNSSLPEVVDEAGIYVDGTDPTDLQKALLSLFDPALRADLIAKGQKQSARFTFKSMADELAAGFLDTARRLEAGEVRRPDASWKELRYTQKRYQDAAVAAAAAALAQPAPTASAPTASAPAASAPAAPKKRLPIGRKVSREIRRILRQFSIN